MSAPEPRCTCVWVVMMGKEHRFFTPGCGVHVEGQTEARVGLPYEPSVPASVVRRSPESGHPGGRRGA